MLFLKYVSDRSDDLRDQYHERYQGDEERIAQAMRGRLVVPEECQFTYLYSKRDNDNIGELITAALEKIGDENKQELEGVNVYLDAKALGPLTEKTKLLKQILEDFAKLSLRRSVLGNPDVIGDVYESLIARFAGCARKKAGEFYTPPGVSTLLAKLLRPKSGDRICDPACGSGSLLIKVAREVGSDGYSLAGQESNAATAALCKMNMFLHGIVDARIEIGDTLTNPHLTADDGLLKFDIVVANPPFNLNLEKWRYDKIANNDPFRRFWRRPPPKNHRDFAFITHMIETASPTGRVGVIVSHGVLFRAGDERIIRQQLIEENLLEAVIGLPQKLFYGTSIPAAILIFSKQKNDRTVLFIDASREYELSKNQNELQEKQITKIVDTYWNRQTIPNYSCLASMEELTKNDFNLNISRYVDTSGEEDQIDWTQLVIEKNTLKTRLSEVEAKIEVFIKELGYDA